MPIKAFRAALTLISSSSLGLNGCALPVLGVLNAFQGRRALLFLKRLQMFV
jgi:hypothetical protein